MLGTLLLLGGMVAWFFLVIKPTEKKLQNFTKTGNYENPVSDVEAKEWFIVEAEKRGNPRFMSTGQADRFAEQWRNLGSGRASTLKGHFQDIIRNVDNIDKMNGRY